MLPTPLLISVYRRALRLYHAPLSDLAWTAWPSATSPSYYSSLLTSEVSDTPPPRRIPLHPSDHCIRPSPSWFPALLLLCASRGLTLRFATSHAAASTEDPYYGDLVTGTSPSLPNLLYTVPHLLQALSVYSRAAYARMGVRELWLVEALRYRGADGWTALPSLPSGRFYLSCERVERVFLLSLLHHELFHFIDHTTHRAPVASSPASSLDPPSHTFCAVPDAVWDSLNSPAFRYGAGGSASSSRHFALSYSGHVPGSRLARGFVNRYAMVAMEEDRAEVWAALVRDRASVLQADDEAIRQKGAELERRVRVWSNGAMDGHWWRRLQRRRGGGGFSLTLAERSAWGRLTRGRWESRHDGDGVQYWHNARTLQSVRINPNVFLQPQRTWLQRLMRTAPPARAHHTPGHTEHS